MAAEVHGGECPGGVKGTRCSGGNRGIQHVSAQTQGKATGKGLMRSTGETLDSWPAQSLSTSEGISPTAQPLLSFVLTLLSLTIAGWSRPCQYVCYTSALGGRTLQGCFKN